MFVPSEAKQQVLANLANFSYDPNNTEYLLQLQVPDLFLDMLSEENEDFVEFGMGEFQPDSAQKSDGLSLRKPSAVASCPQGVCVTSAWTLNAETSSCRATASA